jgi:hypothetical protein
MASTPGVEGIGALLVGEYEEEIGALGHFLSVRSRRRGGAVGDPAQGSPQSR